MSLRTFFARERAYLQELPKDQRFLLLGAFLYGIAGPTLYVFSNTYLWRQSPDPIVIALFNAGFFAGLPFGFIANGILLRRIRSTYLYLLGCVMQGTVPIILVSLQANASNSALLLGIILGIAGGFFWGNRNYLTSELTVNAERFKFISLESTAGTIAAISAPIITGWLLILGEKTGWYTTQGAYQVAAGLAFAILVAAGICVAQIKTRVPNIRAWRVTNPSASWNRLRALDVLNGLVDGIESPIPLVILLTFVGLEDLVGTIDSAAAILASVGLYILGKRANQNHHLSILSAWAGLTFLGRAIFGLLYSTVGALIFYAIEGFSGMFRWTSMAAVVYDTIDQEQRGATDARRYAYLTDRETFLNIGRVTALLLFILAYTYFPTGTIRYGLMFAVLAQAGMLILVKKQLAILPQIPLKKVLQEKPIEVQSPLARQHDAR